MNMAFYVQDRRPPQLQGWSDDAQKAMAGGPEYFQWWSDAKTVLLIALTVAWLRQRARNAGAAVVCLFLAGGPLHVSGLVVSIVVDPLDGECLVGPRADVSDECVEAVQPAGTDGDAAPAIILPLLEARVGATLLHCSPNRVFGSLSALVGREPFKARATAACSFPAMEIGRMDDLLAAAITPAENLPARFVLNDEQSAKFAAKNGIGAL